MAAEKVEPVMAPRHVAKKQAGEGQYKDRAAMRRSGKDDEYKDVSWVAYTMIVGGLS